MTVYTLSTNTYFINNSLTAFPANSIIRYYTIITNFTIPRKTYAPDFSFVLQDPSSNNPGSFTYESSTTSVATVYGNIITIKGAGDCIITARQDACGNYLDGSANTTFTVDQATPTITNFTVPTKTYGDASFVLQDPSSNSTGEFTYSIHDSSSNTAIISIDGKTVTILKSGSVEITARQASTANYTENTKTTTLKINKITTVIDFTVPSTIKYGDSFALDPSSNNHDASFSYSSSNTNVADISGNVVTIKGTGSVDITVSQAETTNYTAGTVTKTLNPDQLTPTIGVFTIPSQTYAPDFSFILAAPSSNSSGAFSYSIDSSSNTNVADISGNVVTIKGAGSTTIIATQASTNNYSSASTSGILFVSQATPTIRNFTIPTKTYEPGYTFFLTDPSSNSNGAFSYIIGNSAIADISGNKVTIKQAGATTITASQAQTTNYRSGSIDASFVVYKATPAISTTNIDKTYGDGTFDIRPYITSNSDGDFTYTITGTSIATINGNTVTILGAGNVTINFSQAETTNYTSVSSYLYLNISRAQPYNNDTIIATIIKYYRDASFVLQDPSSPPYSPGYTSTSYSISDPSIATINGKTVTIVGAGNATISGTQSGNANYEDFRFTYDLTVNAISPTITNFTVPTKTYGDASFVLQDPSSNSTGRFTYTSSNTSIATIFGKTVTITGAGTTTITATQDASGNYTQGSVNTTFIVNTARPSITNFTIPTKKYGDALFVLQDPSSNSSGRFIYKIANTGVADICGNVITINGAGTSIVTVIQDASGNYRSTAANTTFTVNKATPTITNFSVPIKLYGDASFTLVDPSSNVPGDFSYNSSNGNVATIDVKTVTITGPGITTITATQHVSP